MFTFGGGYAMLPLLMREIVDKNKWLNEEEFADLAAIGQCTPGIIAVDMASFVGYKLHKTIGAIIATLGVVLPSVIIITIIAAVLRPYMEIAVVQHAFAGIRVAICGLIIKTVVTLFRSTVKGAPAIVLALSVFTLLAFFGVSPILLAVGAAVISVAVGLFKQRRAGK